MIHYDFLRVNYSNHDRESHPRIRKSYFFINSWYLCQFHKFSRDSLLLKSIVGITSMIVPQNGLCEATNNVLSQPLSYVLRPPLHFVIFLDNSSLSIAKSLNRIFAIFLPFIPSLNSQTHKKIELTFPFILNSFM
jgi:hypothetical protein